MAMCDLLTVPARIARMLFGTDSPADVIQRVRRFSAVFDDMSDVVNSVALERLIAVTLGALAFPEERSRLNRLCYDLDMLAFEAYGAAIEWRKTTGDEAPEGVFIWVSRLCCCPSADRAGFDSSIWGIGEYVLCTDPSTELTNALLDMCDAYITACRWENVPDCLLLYAIVAVVASKPARLSETIRHKRTKDAYSEDFLWTFQNWLDLRTNELGPEAVESFRFLECALNQRGLVRSESLLSEARHCWRDSLYKLVS